MPSGVRTRTSGIIVSVNVEPVPVPVSYVGPGDIVSSAIGWWGLRAYSAASIGSNVLRVRRSSDSTEKTFVSLANGNFNTADTFFDGSNYFVTTLYDQSGNGNNLTQTTAANQ